MGRLEKVFVIFSLSYMIVYSVYFLYSMKAPDNFEGILPFHFLGMALSLGFLIIVIRDVFKRNFSNPNSKALWALAIIMFWPSVFIYLPKYGFKSRNVILESDNRGGRGCLDRKQGFISGKLLMVHDHAAACFCDSVPK